MIAFFLVNISVKYYKNLSMLSRVIAKNVGDIFWDTVYIVSLATPRLRESILVPVEPNLGVQISMLVKMMAIFHMCNRWLIELPHSLTEDQLQQAIASIKSNDNVFSFWIWCGLRGWVHGQN